MPGIEHRCDGAPELLAGILRKWRAVLALDGCFVVGDNFAPRLLVEIRVGGKSVEVLEVLEDVLERAVIDTQNDIAVHLNKAAITVEREAGIARQRGQPFNGFVVQPEIKDGVHHSGHRGTRTGPDRDQQRPLFIAETAGDRFADRVECLHHVGSQRVGQFVSGSEERFANVRRDRESGRHRKPEPRHLREIGTLAAEKFRHAGAALGLAGDEGVNPFPFAVSVWLCHQTSGAVFMLTVMCFRETCHSS